MVECGRCRSEVAREMRSWGILKVRQSSKDSVFACHTVKSDFSTITGAFSSSHLALCFSSSSLPVIPDLSRRFPSPFPGVYEDDVPVPRSPFCMRTTCPLLSKFFADAEYLLVVFTAAMPGS
jgi:hypothetical protein